jgi:branched-chain amino acid aminotransferase
MRSWCIKGRVKETTSANFFVVRDGTVLTAPLGEGVLAGVTRDLVLALARAATGEAREEPIALADLARAEAAFATGSVAGVRSSVERGGRPAAPPDHRAAPARLRRGARGRLEDQ